MTRDDMACLNVGREVVRMIHELRAKAKQDIGFTRRSISFPGGEVILLICDTEVAETAEKAIAAKFTVETVDPDDDTEAKKQ